MSVVVDAGAPAERGATKPSLPFWRGGMKPPWPAELADDLGDALSGTVAGRVAGALTAAFAFAGAGASGSIDTMDGPEPIDNSGGKDVRAAGDGPGAVGCSSAGAGADGGAWTGAADESSARS